MLGAPHGRADAPNHLPGGGDLGLRPPGGYGEIGFDGMGFGLRLRRVAGTGGHPGGRAAGEYYWGGLASTIFWVDPVEDVVVVFMTQLMPSGTFDFRGQLKAIVYGALVD